MKTQKNKEKRKKKGIPFGIVLKYFCHIYFINKIVYT